MSERPYILVAEDDSADVLLLKTAARQAALESELRFVPDGIDLLDYLTGEGRFEEPDAQSKPYLVLLDLNMPRMDGKAALREMRITAESQAIPVVVLSTTDRPEEIRECLKLGANSFVVKPVAIGELGQLLKTLEDYWLKTVARA